MIRGDALERAQRASQRRAIDGRQATEVVEQHARPDPVQHAFDVAVAQRRHPERDVLVGLGEDPPDTEDDDRTEERIALHADHELARSLDHALDQQDGILACGERQKRAGGGPHGVVAVEIQGDQAAFRLVTDARPDGLQRHRTVESTGDGRGLVLAARDAARRDGDPVAGEQRLRLTLVQRLALVGYRVGYDRRRIALGGRRRRHHAAIVVRLGSHARSCPDSLTTVGPPVGRRRRPNVPSFGGPFAIVYRIVLSLKRERGTAVVRDVGQESVGMTRCTR